MRAPRPTPRSRGRFQFYSPVPFSIFGYIKQQMKHLSLFESSELTYWYYGLADCHGIESFIIDQTTDDWDLMFAKEDSLETTKGQIMALAMRAFSNKERKAVAFRAMLHRSDVDAIEELLKSGEHIKALDTLKQKAIEVEVASFGFPKDDSRKNWELIPNPKLDPYSTQK